MVKKLYTESDVQAIAAAIRSRNGTSNTYTVSQMAPAIQALSTKPVLPQKTNFRDSKDDLYTFLNNCNLVELASRADFSHMFDGCTFLSSIPAFNTGNATDMSYMFYNCMNLASVPLLNTSNVTNTSYMFASCQMQLTSVPAFNLSKVTDSQNMFEDCHALTSAPAFTFGSLNKCAYMFQDCTSLTAVALFDTSTCTDVGAMFNGCSALVTIPQFDYSNVTSFGATLSETKIYYGCTSLSDASLNNILGSMAGATSYTGGLLRPKTLAFLGLTRDQATRCQNLSNYAAFTAAGWSTGY